MMLNIFLCAYMPLLSFLKNYVFKSFAHIFIEFFFFLWLSCKISLYILDISPLLARWFANTFSHSMHCLFTFLIFSSEIMSSEARHSKILMKTNLSMFSLLTCLFGVDSKKVLIISGFQSSTSVCSSKSFIALILRFRPLIHFELILYNDTGTNFIFRVWISSANVPTPFVENIILSPMTYFSWLMITLRRYS